MLLSARILNNVSDVNSFEYATECKFTEGDTLYIYFQLIDLNKDLNLKPPGRRFIPASGATLTATVHNIDASKILVKTATQPYASDTSIWRFQVTAADVLRGTYSIKLALTESSVVTRGVIKSGLSVEPQSGTLV